MIVQALSSLDDLTRTIRENTAGRVPLIIGVAGSVGVGKTTLAVQLSERLSTISTNCSVVSTDGFLLPNSILDERGLLLRKGYPESYDDASISRFFAAIRAGAPTVETPKYSHQIFDLDGTQRHEIREFVIVEGVNALQHPVVADLDVRVYLDAAEPVVRAWFVARMLSFINDAEHDPSSFYAQFVELDAPGRSDFATRVWEGINLPNLVDHIAPSASHADWTVTVDSTHEIESVQPAGRDSK